MASRKDAVNFCMICSHAPCECNKKKPVVAVKRKPAGQTPVAAQQQPEELPKIKRPVAVPTFLIQPGQGFTRDPLEEPVKSRSRPLQTSTSCPDSATIAPVQLPAPEPPKPQWHEDVPVLTFAEVQAFDEQMVLQSAIQCLSDAGLVTGDSALRAWRESTQGNSDGRVATMPQNAE